MLTVKEWLVKWYVSYITHCPATVTGQSVGYSFIQLGDLEQCRGPRTRFHMAGHGIRPRILPFQCPMLYSRVKGEKKPKTFNFGWS